jgi:hypothetical protein
MSDSFATRLVRTILPSYPTCVGACRGLRITHLHGYLPPLPPDQVVGGTIAARPVVLAEDDYHAVAVGRAADRRVDTSWIGNEFNRLFHEHQVLMLGMSLTDPNLRRVLATLGDD